jgi:hypothetical protein
MEHPWNAGADRGAVRDFCGVDVARRVDLDVVHGYVRDYCFTIGRLRPDGADVLFEHPRL